MRKINSRNTPLYDTAGFRNSNKPFTLFDRQILIDQLKTEDYNPQKDVKLKVVSNRHTQYIKITVNGNTFLKVAQDLLFY